MSRARDKANSTVSNFASTGIDDNADANAVTIDSSERVGVSTTAMTANLEVGSASSKINALTVKTATGSGGVAGISFMAGQTTAGREKAAIFFKETNGGAHYTGDLVFAIATSSGSAAQVAASDEVCRITSGGIAIGGTGSANTLDDYEEGTFTPRFQQGLSSPGYSTQEGTYVKIGSLVVCSVHLRANSGTGNGDVIYIGGLPFTVITGSGIDHQYGAFFTYNGGFWTSDANTQWLARPNETNLAFFKQADGGVIQGNTSGVATNLNADCRVVAVYRS